VAVIGDGKLGQLIARVLATTGCELELIGKHADNLRLAARAGVSTVLVEDGKVDAGPHRDFVVEASGAPSGLQLAINLVRPRGTIILKSTFHGPVPLETWRIVVDELTVIGSRCGRFVRALELLKAGEVDVEQLIAGEYPLGSGVAAMTAAAQPGALKVVLKP
jgi:threonine dehydrogenase-like Zn-dependent dehydrogenase